jgi:hypothetical protein
MMASGVVADGFGEGAWLVSMAEHASILCLSGHVVKEKGINLGNSQLILNFSLAEFLSIA